MIKLTEIFKGQQAKPQTPPTNPVPPTKVLINGLHYTLDVERLTASVSGCEDEREGEVIIPESVECGDRKFVVTSIAPGAFSRCKYITTVTIASTVTSIGKDAFRLCADMEAVTCLGLTPPACSPGVMAYVSGTDCTLMVPAKAQSRYKQTEPWSHFMTIIALQPSPKA